MKIPEQDLLDPLPILMQEAFTRTAHQDSSPCSVCRALGEHVQVRTHFHGSDLGSCPRKVYWEMIGGRGHTSSSNAAFLKDGHLHEADILTGLEKGMGSSAKITRCLNNEELTVQFPVSDSHGTMVIKIIGHHDGEIKYNETGTKAILECKAVKEYTFDKVRKGEISQVWYGQMQFYMAAKKIPLAYLLVKNRVTSAILKPIRIPIDIPWIKERIERIKGIYELVHTTGTTNVPDREHKTPKADECQFCPFKDRCWPKPELMEPPFERQNPTLDFLKESMTKESLLYTQLKEKGLINTSPEISEEYYQKINTFETKPKVILTSEGWVSNESSE